jgi:hypothetical protein
MDFLDFNGYDDSQDFLDWLRIFYSKFVISSSWFLYPIVHTETPAFENAKKEAAKTFHFTKIL